jgi:short subunit fatty acids transporter
VVIRTVAKAARASAGEGALGVPLVLTAHYRSLALAAGGFSATARLAFASPGHRLVRVSMAVRFIEVVHRQHKRARKGSHR